MTNAEKYLKDGVDDRDFAKALSNYIADGGRIIKDKEDIRIETLYFLTDEVKPTLTEDEKVILKNIGSRYIRIARTSINKDLYVTNNDKTIQHFLFAFSHLFQSIKPGEEYKISDLLEE